MMPFWQESGTLTDTQFIVEEPKNISHLSILGFKIINKTQFYLFTGLYCVLSLSYVVLCHFILSTL